jgi:hypothetical protein
MQLVEIAVTLIAVILLVLAVKAIIDTTCGIFRILFSVGALIVSITLSTLINTLKRRRIRLSAKSLFVKPPSNPIQITMKDVEVNYIGYALESAAARIKATGSHAFKLPTNSFLSLCMVVGMANVTGLFAQESSSPAKHNTPLPITRVITSTDGRFMSGSVVAIGDNMITFRRNSDGRTFDIVLNTLSEADQTFFRGWEAPPAYKPSSVSVSGSPSLARSSYPSAYQPRRSGGGGGGGMVSGAGRMVCRPTGSSTTTTPCK